MMSININHTEIMGMTINERLFSFGLLDDFDKYKKSNIRKAFEILESVKVDRDSILNILKIKMNIPKQKLLEAACNYYAQDVLNLLKGYSLTKKQIKCINNRKDLHKIFLFSDSNLLIYLKENKWQCDKQLAESYDKRCTPSTFIEEYEDGYRVGWFDKDYSKLRTWNTIFEAAADYILLSWSLGRLENSGN